MKLSCFSHLFFPFLLLAEIEPFCHAKRSAEVSLVLACHSKDSRTLAATAFAIGALHCIWQCAIVGKFGEFL